MIGAGIFFVIKRAIERIVTTRLSNANPLFCIRIIEVTAIKPLATALIPFNDILIAFIFFRFVQIGYMKKMRSKPGRKIPIPPATDPTICNATLPPRAAIPPA